MSNKLFLIKSYYEDFYFNTGEELKSNFKLFNCNDDVTTLSILNNEKYYEIFSLNLNFISDRVSSSIFQEIVETIDGIITETNTPIQDIIDSYNEYGNFAMDYIVFNRSVPHGIKETFRLKMYIDYYNCLYDDWYHYLDYESYIFKEFGKYIYDELINSNEIKKYGEVSGIFTQLIDYKKFGIIMLDELGWKSIGTHLYKK